MDPRVIVVAAVIGLTVYGGMEIVKGVKHVGHAIVHVIKR